MQQKERVNGKILLTDELTFDTVEDALLKLGYSWFVKGKMRVSDIPTSINMFFFYKTGVMKYASDSPDSKFWLQHPNKQYTIEDGQLVEFK